VNDLHKKNKITSVFDPGADEDSFSFYPNPVLDKLFIILSGDQKATFEIHSPDG
jgi:hypothetical protein